MCMGKLGVHGEVGVCTGKLGCPEPWGALQCVGLTPLHTRSPPVLTVLLSPCMDLSHVPATREKGWYLALMAPNTKGPNYAWLDPSRLYCHPQVPSARAGGTRGGLALGWALGPGGLGTLRGTQHLRCLPRPCRTAWPTCCSPSRGTPSTWWPASMPWASSWVRGDAGEPGVPKPCPRGGLTAPRPPPGAAVATALRKGFLAIRKAGHLCVETLSEPYTDYSGREKVMEVRTDTVSPGEPRGHSRHGGGCRRRAPGARTQPLPLPRSARPPGGPVGGNRGHHASGHPAGGAPRGGRGR